MQTKKSKSTARYLKTVRRPAVVLNPRKDAALIAAIDSDPTAFSERCKSLLRNYYNVE